MAFPQFEVLNTATEMDIARTLSGTTAANGIHLAITDTSTIASGYPAGLLVAYAASGAKTGGQLNAIATELSITGNTPLASCFNAYVAAIANKTVDGVYAFDSYMEDAGTACGRYYSLNLQQVHTNAATESGFIRMRNAGSTVLNAIFQIEANNPATYLFRMGAGTPYHSSNVSVSDGRLQVYIDGTARYLAVYSS